MNKTKLCPYFRALISIPGSEEVVGLAVGVAAADEAAVAAEEDAGVVAEGDVGVAAEVDGGVVAEDGDGVEEQLP
jgi:hypothetical protein